MTCTFGELLLRFSPALPQQWIYNAAMPVYIGGAELNVANALACWELPIRYITRLPENSMSEAIVSYLAQSGIDVTQIQWGGNRIGLYYLPQGEDLKNANVIYDRAYSSFGEWKPGTTRWEQLLDGCQWLHWSAITPALNEGCAELCAEILKVAKQKGITVSVDLNYRSKLWQYGVKPEAVMTSLLPYCDVVMGNLWSVESLLNIPSVLPDSKGRSTEELVAAAVDSMTQVQKTYPRVKAMAYTFRLEKEYFGVLMHEGKVVTSHKFALQNIVDKVGSGDCFMAAFIYGLQKRFTAEECINFAAAAAVGKMQEKGDATRQSVNDILQRIYTSL